MKYSLLALALIPSFAHAGFSCKSVEQGPDHGYFAQSTDDGQVEISMQSIAGPQPVATLDCYTPVGTGNPNIPHAIQIYGDKTPRGVKFVITSGGVVGISANLSLSQASRTIPMVCRLF